jgi:hypothetical protein
MPGTRHRLASLQAAAKATRDEIDSEIERILSERDADAARKNTEAPKPS